MIPYSFHPEAEAEAELEEATLFYESRMASLGKSFSAAMQRAVLLIREHPDAGSPIGGSSIESSFSLWLTNAGVLITGVIESNARTLKLAGSATRRPQ